MRLQANAIYAAMISPRIRLWEMRQIDHGPIPWP